MLSIHIASVGCLNLIAKQLGLINQRLSELNDFSIILRFLAPSKGIQYKLGFWILRRGFRIPIVNRIRNPRFLDSKSKNFLDSLAWSYRIEVNKGNICWKIVVTRKQRRGWTTPYSMCIILRIILSPHQQMFHLFLPEEQRLHVFLHQYTRASCWRQNPDFFQPSHSLVSAISSHRSCCRPSKKKKKKKLINDV